MQHRCLSVPRPPSTGVHLHLSEDRFALKLSPARPGRPDERTFARGSPGIPGHARGAPWCPT